MEGQPPKKKIKLRIIFGNNRFNKLTDDILHRILSFVDVKTAISTIVLSKRWRFIWPTHPRLDFMQWRAIEEDHPINREAEANLFLDFLHRRLVFGQQHIINPVAGGRRANIESFSLRADAMCGLDRINDCVIPLWSTTIFENSTLI